MPWIKQSINLFGLRSERTYDLGSGELTKKVISEKRKLWTACRQHLYWHDGCAGNEPVTQETTGGDKYECLDAGLWKTDDRFITVFVENGKRKWMGQTRHRSESILVLLQI